MRQSSNSNDFKIDILEFEGKLDLDDFVEWMQTVERIFEFKEISEDKKVKLIALKLRKYASLWWTNLLTKRVRQGKGKIRTWEKMKAKLTAHFLPPNYIAALIGPSQQAQPFGNSNYLSYGSFKFHNLALSLSFRSYPFNKTSPIGLHSPLQNAKLSQPIVSARLDRNSPGFMWPFSPS